MTNAEIIEKLHRCIPHCWDGCSQNCELFNAQNCHEALARAAAAALEALQAQAEHTDQVDAMNFAMHIKQVARIAELEAQNAELVTKCNQLQAQMPKEGEWQWLSSTYDRVPREMRYWCSVCHHEEITHNDKPWKHYCPNCGARMRGEQE